MLRYGIWTGGIAVALAIFVPAAWAQDMAKVAEKAVEANDPDAVDPNTIKGEKWTLDLKFDQPEPIVVTTPGNDREVYWYVVYTVTNNTGQAREFVPTFTHYADTTAVRRAGLYPTVFDAIKRSRKIRFLENAVAMVGKVLPGEDNARTGVAIFAPLDRETDRFTIFVEGLSGEYIQKTDLAGKPEGPLPPAAAPKDFDKPDDAKVRLRKTLAIEYWLPGDKWWLNLDRPVFVTRKWTWR